jgi:triosephosphate isomerase
MKVFANFKAYLDFAETNILVSQLLQSDVVARTPVELALFPSTLAFTEVEKALRGTGIDVGVQHIVAFDSGATTGEMNAKQVADAGATYVLVGHSEQRHIMGETDEQVELQFRSAIAAGLIPVLCVGETAKELEEGHAKVRISEQLNFLKDITSEYIVAYEPVWAITGSGSGKNCDPKQAADMHMYMKQILGDAVPVLYGGSVTAEHVVSYTSLPSVDGVLVGSAATSFKGFTELIEALR